MIESIKTLKDLNDFLRRNPTTNQDLNNTAMRQPSALTQKVRRLWQVTKTMRAYKKQHPKCAWCSRQDGVAVHHKIPVSIKPTKAADLDNLISLCHHKRDCHLIVGHKGNWKHYEKQLDQIIAISEHIQTQKNQA